MKDTFDRFILKIDGLSEKDFKSLIRELTGLTRGALRYFQRSKIKKVSAIYITNNKSAYDKFIEHNKIELKDDTTFKGVVKDINVLCKYQNYDPKKFREIKEGFIKDIIYFHVENCIDDILNGKKGYDWLKRGFAIYLSETNFNKTINCTIDDLKNDVNVDDDTAATIVSSIKIISYDRLVSDKTFLFEKVQDVFDNFLI